MNDSGPPFEL